MRTRNSSITVAAIVMLLMLGTMVVTPSQNLRAQQEPVVVYGWVFDDMNGNGNFDEPLESGLDGVQVDLHDVSSTDPVSYTTGGGGYFEFDISRPSYYKIGIEPPGESLEEGKIYFGNETAIFRVHDENVNVGYIGLKSRIVNATISGAVTEGETGNSVNDATVTLRDKANNYEISQQTYPIHEYENLRDKWMISPEIILPDSSELKLSFMHWYWMEDGRDGGNVQISTDGGGSWVVLEPYQGQYPSSNVVNGQPGYTDKRGWHEVRINLLPWEGSTVNIAFRFTSDSSNVEEGWYIDVIKVKADAETIFSDDAESEEVGWNFQPSEDPWQISDHNYDSSSPSHSWYCGLDIEGWYSIDTYDGDYEIEVTHEDYSPSFLHTTVQPNNIMATFKNTRIIPLSETLYLNGNTIDSGNYQMDYPSGKANFSMTIDDTDVVTADYDYKVFVENESLAFGALGGELGATLANSNITSHTLYLDGIIWADYVLNNTTGVVVYDYPLVRGALVLADYTYDGTIDVFGEILTSTGVLSLHPVDALSVVVWIDGSPTTNYTLDDLNGEIAFLEPVYNASFITVSYDAIVSVVGETVQLTGGTRADIELFKYRIRGRAFESPNGPGITDTAIHVAAYDLNNSRVLIHTVSPEEAPTFWIGVYPETYVVVIRIDGYKSITIPSVTVTDETIPLGEQYFEKSDEEQIRHEITFMENDWNNFTLSTSWKLNSESYLEGMDYAELHNIRLQVDVVLGNGDGTLDVSEITALGSWLWEKGPRYVITDEFFLTDDNHYVSKHNSFNVSVENALSSVNSTEPLWINTTTIFNTTGIESGADEYLLTQFVDYDTTVMGQTQKNYTYRIELPTQDGKRYEMVENDTVTGVEVKGFLTIRIDPPQGSGGPVRVDMTVRPSENGTAKIEITDPIDPLDGVTILNSTYDNYTAVVRASLNITFSAESSTDPNSPTGRVQSHQNFTWIFDKSNPVESTRYNITAVYNYTVGGPYTVNLTISESGGEPGGNVTYREATIFADELDPVAYTTVNVTDPEEGFDPANDRTIEVNESVAIVFNAEKSTDLRYDSVGGRVTNWKWDLESDGTWDEFLSNFTYAFAQPGDYTVNATVADEVGHWSENASVYFVVKDITPPTVRVTILNDTFIPKSSAIENKTFWFNASETSDNYDELENLTFEWDFGDGTIIPAAVGNYNVSHNYTQIDTYNLTVNVTDRAGNAGNTTITIPVLVDAASRPDLEVVPGTFIKDPESVEEGKSVKLSVNLTNKANHAVAQNVEVHFYLVEGDDEKEIGAGSLKFYNESGLVSGPVKINATEQVTAEISWTPKVVGKLTIVVRIRDAEEHSQQIGTDNSMTTFLTVEQAPWKTWLVYIVLIVIIFVVIIVVWLRRKWQRGELKLRRKEKEEPKEKKKKK